ncbi:MAG: hypothetical protein AB1894_11835 [Chloroflexota bacterium]
MPPHLHSCPAQKLALLLLFALLLNACGASAGKLSPTQTAQVERSRALATQMAQSLQATYQVESAQSTATAQAFQSLFESARNWPLVSLHDFEQPSSDWLLGEQDNDYGASNLEVQDGQYQWKVKSLQGLVWWSVPDIATVSDFYAAVQCQQIEGPEDGQLGLIFRKDPDDQYYIFQIDQQGQFSIYLRYAEEWHTLWSWSPSSAISLQEPNRLAVMAQADQFYFFVNNQLVAGLQDNRLPEGEIGLLVGLPQAAQSGQWVFDNFEVRAP